MGRRCGFLNQGHRGICIETLEKGSIGTPGGQASPTVGASRVIMGVAESLFGLTCPLRLSLLRWQFLTTEWVCLPSPPNLFQEGPWLKERKKMTLRFRAGCSVHVMMWYQRLPLGAQGLPAPIVHLPTLLGIYLLPSWHLKGVKSPNAIT